MRHRFTDSQSRRRKTRNEISSKKRNTLQNKTGRKYKILNFKNSFLNANAQFEKHFSKIETQTSSSSSEGRKWGGGSMCVAHQDKLKFITL